MIAMNGPTPSVNVGGAVGFPGEAVTTQAAFGALSLPAFGPIAPERPAMGLPADSPFALASLSYTQEPVSRAAKAFEALERPVMTADDVVRSWNRQHGSISDREAGGFIAAGSFTDAGEAERLAGLLSSLGRVVLEAADADGVKWYSVNVYPDGRGSVDEMLQTAWSLGATDAMTVRE